MLAYQELLNEAQYRVVSADFGPMLVIAGAGTGKTRTIVFRLAWLVEHGVEPWNILLLTFTRKAAKEMLERAGNLLGEDLYGLYGGTFHAFAFRVLRQYRPGWLGDMPFRVMDASDQQDAVRQCREGLDSARKERGFPKTPAIVGLFSKSRNKELPLRRLIERETPSLLPFVADLEALFTAYTAYKQENFLLDYDDLLFELENLLVSEEAVRQQLQERYRHILVDEYQDTNLVQARIVRLLADGGDDGRRSVMAVGDEAQSIYAFRGATVRNILEFPKLFPGTRVVALEENYRSVQPVLDAANRLMEFAEEGYAKHLVAVRGEGQPVDVVCCQTDSVQAKCVARQIADLLETSSPEQIAVLFRSSFHSYQLETELTRLGIAFRKYGGIRFLEAAHIKDLLAFLFLVVNPRDKLSFLRFALLHHGIGPKTAEKIFQSLGNADASKRYAKKYPQLFQELALIEDERGRTDSVAGTIEAMMDLYRPYLEDLHPEDYATRWLGLQEILSMAGSAEDLDLFLAEMLLDSVEEEEATEGQITLSTIHSAKGLEWDNVFVLDLVDGRFPSRHALERRDSMEEERRLMYVACTRARDSLRLYWYTATGNQGSLYDCARSQFLAEAAGDGMQSLIGAASGRVSRRIAVHSRPSTSLYGDPYAERAEPAPERGWQGRARLRGDEDDGEVPRRRPQAADPEGMPIGRIDMDGADTGRLVEARLRLKDIRAGRITRCRHRIFGSGTIAGVDEDKLVIDFPLHGRKKIVAAFVFVEDVGK